MPRYFFHVHDGVAIQDDEGTELTDLRAARRAAVQLAGAMLADEPDQFWNHGEWSIDVADEHGLTLFSLAFIGTDAPAIRR